MASTKKIIIISVVSFISGAILACIDDYIVSTTQHNSKKIKEKKYET